MGFEIIISYSVQPIGLHLYLSYEDSYSHNCTNRAKLSKATSSPTHTKPRRINFLLSPRNTLMYLMRCWIQSCPLSKSSNQWKNNTPSLLNSFVFKIEYMQHSRGNYASVTDFWSESRKVLMLWKNE